MAAELPLAFKTFRTTRFHMLRELEGLSQDDLLAIPEGRDDNVLWNVGHLLCSLARLTYVRSGFALPIPEHYLALFGKNTTARDWTDTPDADEVFGHFHALPGQIEADYASGRFSRYEPLELAPGHTVESVEEAIAFHCFHEGLHIGMIISVKELLGLGVVPLRTNTGVKQ